MFFFGGGGGNNPVLFVSYPILFPPPFHQISIINLALKSDIITLSQKCSRRRCWIEREMGWDGMVVGVGVWGGEREGGYENGGKRK